MEKNLKTKSFDKILFKNQLMEYLKRVIVDEMILNSFIEPLRISNINNDNVVFVIENEETKNHILENYSKIIKNAVEKIIGHKSKINYILNGQEVIAQDNKTIDSTKETHTSLDHTFDNYTTSDFNSEAVSMSKTIIENPGKFSPFYVSSNSGLGKTHLLHAISNEFIKNGLNPMYIEPSLFTQKIQTLPKGGITNFVKNLKKYDVLLFDDIQNIGDRVVTLDIVFQLLNYFIDNKKQIIFASDKVSQELSGFEERYITRFESGISSIIKKPNVNDIAKVLINKLEKSKMHLELWDKDAINFVARNNTSSIRSLEGSINRILFFTSTHSNPKYTQTLIFSIFKELTIDVSELTPKRIISVVSNYYKITKTNILGKSRKKPFVLPRHIAIYLIRKITSMSYKEIGKEFGGRDHSTIMSSINSIENKIKIDISFKNALRQIERKIRTIS